jgi:hypothetical protein
MTNENIDVYLKPLVEELNTLWKGVTIIIVTKGRWVSNIFIEGNLYVEHT